MSRKRVAYTPFEIRSLRRFAEARKRTGIGFVDAVDWPGKPQQLGAAVTCLQKKGLLDPARITGPDGRTRTHFTLSPTALAMTE